MPSSKLTSRRGTPVRPHVCHPPPPPVIPPGPPTGTYWLAPTWQQRSPGNAANGDIHCESSGYPPEAIYDITWTIPCGTMLQGFFCGNGDTEIWEWDPEGAEGDYDLKAEVFMDSTLCATLWAHVLIEEGPA